MTNHKHLRLVIEDIYSKNNQLTQDLAFKLINEFRYSNLYIPAKRENYELNFIIYEDEDFKITPLFTDLDEFNKFFKNDTDIEIMQNPFEVYQNILKSSDLEGYILNPSSEKYLFRKEFILSIKNIPKTNYFALDAYSTDELKNMKNQPNESLENFIKNPNNIGNFEGLFEQFSKSNILTLMVSDVDLTTYATDGVISMTDSGPLAQMHVDKVGGEYATIFSSEDKLKEVKTDKFKYSQVVNLSMLVNFVLSEDMDGIILNLDSDDVLISRQTLLKYSLGFEKYVNDERLCESIYYMFLIE